MNWSYQLHASEDFSLIPVPIGGVHKIQILIRDLLKEILQKIFGEEMGGVRGTQTPL